LYQFLQQVLTLPRGPAWIRIYFDYFVI
jgi:hypothetical protein